MIAVDTNVLVYAHREDAEFHAAAATALRQLIESGQSWAIPWPCVHEFLSVVTNKRIYISPTPLATALSAVDAWLAVPSLSLLGEQGNYWDRLREVAVAGRVQAGMVHDARVAALCLQHGVHALWTADRDFGRFPALRVLNPLVVAG